mmetsp:Transcript_14113/g.25187  ORF Transcript_14113/g.25187 Transcript_14113/m.25187 type:complete len:89 (+) Transcript_14113:1644-1910(+)
MSQPLLQTTATMRQLCVHAPTTCLVNPHDIGAGSQQAVPNPLWWPANIPSPPLMPEAGWSSRRRSLQLLATAVIRIAKRDFGSLQWQP